jgi:hypothetical protein
MSYLDSTSLLFLIALDTAKRYADREKKYGVKWQYKKDVAACILCTTKFPTIALVSAHLHVYKSTILAS